jgi:hypothetical protein
MGPEAGIAIAKSLEVWCFFLFRRQRSLS